MLSGRKETNRPVFSHEADFQGLADRQAALLKCGR